jgi:hypothetical protein
MTIGLKVTNPDKARNRGVYIWVQGPTGLVTFLLNNPSVTLSPDLNFNNPNWKTSSIPALTWGEYTLHAVIFNHGNNMVVSHSEAKFTISNY